MLPDTAAYPLGRTAARVARTVGLSETPRTCPFAALEHADPWVSEVTHACVRATGDLHRPVEKSLGRATTAADEAAIAAWDDARNAAAWADHEAWQAEQQKKPST